MTRWAPAPAPPARPATLRIVVGGFAVLYLAVRGSHLWEVAALEPRRWEPVGLLGWTAGPPPASAVRALLVVALAAGCAFVVGWRYRVTAPVFALSLLLLATIRNSWGQVWHTENLLVWHILILACAPAAAWWSLDAHRAGREPSEPHVRYAWAPQLMSVVTVTTYVLAGITKLREGGLDWVFGDTLRNQVAYDAVRKAALGAHYSPVTGTVLAHAWLFVPIAGATLAIELGAPLALLGRAARWVWSVAAWGFHVGVLALMAISFPYQLSGVAYASLFEVERVGIALRERSRLGRWTRSRSSSAPAPTTITSA